MSTTGVDFQVKREDWRQCRFVSAELPEPLDAGQVLLRVDRFALTSNNISYASAGDMLGYWNFFPAEEGWGRLPTMGFGEVIASAHPQVAVGERAFGFYPMSKHLLIQADETGGANFVDAAPHRREHAPAYRQYTRSSADALYDADHEDEHMLLRGLFMTSFLVDDFIADSDFFGAESFVISSASSKTAIALAWLLHERGRGRVIGLTSSRNADFVRGLGYYDDTIPYHDLKSIASNAPTVFVDHAGDGEVVNALHHHLGDQLRHSCIVGATHWGAAPRDEHLPGPSPTFFFAPAQIVKRSKEWGAAGLQERLGGRLSAFIEASKSWLRVVRGRGQEAVEQTYLEVLNGRATPDEGHVLSLWDE